MNEHRAALDGATVQISGRKVQLNNIELIAIRSRIDALPLVAVIAASVVTLAFSVYQIANGSN